MTAHDEPRYSMPKKTMTIWIPLIITVALAAFLTGCKLTRWGYESPEYKVIRKSGPFEIRDYPALTLASTPMQSAQAPADDSFMRLFRYISGANQRETRIAMTTPVLIDVTESNRQMSFVMPKKVAEAGTPNAKRDDIKVETRGAGRFAVYRFRGGWDSARTEEARKQLAKWLAAEDLSSISAPQLANYDPPFTPPFLRRNEMMVRLGATGKDSRK